MKLLKRSIACVIACFVFNSVVLAETVTITGIAYGTRISTEETVLSDGNFKYINSDHSIWVQEGMPEGYPSMASADCRNIGIRSPDYANLGSSWTCTITDIDGDGFVNVGSGIMPDWSGCNYETVAGWGKYTGISQSGTCAFAGQITATDWMLKWTGEFTTP
jgi:hypothetical protein